MNIRAKFKCLSNKEYYSTTWVDGKALPGFLYEYEFSVVHGDSEENKLFFASTPSGMIKVSSVRNDQYKTGKEYYVTFEEADVPTG